MPAAGPELRRAPAARRAARPAAGLRARAAAAPHAGRGPLAGHGSLGRRAAAAPARPRDPQPAWAAYVTGVPVDMRGDRLRRAFEAYGPVVRVEPLPIRYPKRGARSAIVVLGDAQSLERAMRAAPLRVDGARLGVRKFGDPEPSQQAEGSANAVGRQERHALAAAGLVVFAGGVPAACGDAEIKAAFECYGQVSRAWSFPANGSGDGGRARCAFVVFSDTSSRGAGHRFGARGREVAAARAGAGRRAARRRARGHEPTSRDAGRLTTRRPRRTRRASRRTRTRRRASRRSPAAWVCPSRRCRSPTCPSTSGRSAAESHPPPP